MVYITLAGRKVNLIMKKYLPNLISLDNYSTWLDGKKVIINAPTGIGKTTFVIKTLLPYCKLRGKKALILCNRRLLREQYEFSLAEQFQLYDDLIESVEVLTYQLLAEQLVAGIELSRIIDDYDVVICDEIHFFYQDSDFNSMGTYVLLQALIKSAFFKCMIFMTATFEEVKPLLVKTLKSCNEKMEEEKTNQYISLDKYKFHDKVYDYSYLADFSRFQCYYLPDIESIVKKIAKEGKKAVLFIDDKKMAQEVKELFIRTKKYEAHEVEILNAHILDEKITDTNVRMLTAGNKLVGKILITTSVLDNGVSIHDPEVTDIVIATESKTAFMQMIGRVRSESTESCNLYIYPRDVKYYERRLQQYQKKMEFFKEISLNDMENTFFETINRGWASNDEEGEMLRNAVVLTKYSNEYYQKKSTSILLRRREYVLAQNVFAMCKTGNLLLATRNFLQCALKSPTAVAETQISWLGKNAEELIVENSSYKEELKKALLDELLKIQNYTNQELQDVKCRISEKYRKELFADILGKDGSFSTDKLKKICERMGVELIEDVDENRRKRYSVRKVDKEEGKNEDV
jgi:superfamily II DNA or RNA helicase